MAKRNTLGLTYPCKLALLINEPVGVIGIFSIMDEAHALSKIEKYSRRFRQPVTPYPVCAMDMAIIKRDALAAFTA